MYTRNNSGPNTVPCSPPESTSSVADLHPSTSTCCVRTIGGGSMWKQHHLKPRIPAPPFPWLQQVCQGANLHHRGSTYLRTCVCCISLLASLVVRSLVWTIYDDSGIQTKPCITLYIIMSLWLFWRSFRGSHPNATKLEEFKASLLSEMTLQQTA
jgi:hypothetical protein